MAGLYYEAKGQTDLARGSLLRSIHSAYGQTSDDYMVALAHVHVAQRGWTDDGGETPSVVAAGAADEKCT